MGRGGREGGDTKRGMEDGTAPPAGDRVRCDCYPHAAWRRAGVELATCRLRGVLSVSWFNAVEGIGKRSGGDERFTSSSSAVMVPLDSRGVALC